MVYQSPAPPSIFTKTTLLPVHIIHYIYMYKYIYTYIYIVHYKYLYIYIYIYIYIFTIYPLQYIYIYTYIYIYIFTIYPLYYIYIQLYIQNNINNSEVVKYKHTIYIYIHPLFLYIYLYIYIIFSISSNRLHLKISQAKGSRWGACLGLVLSALLVTWPEEFNSGFAGTVQRWPKFRRIFFGVSLGFIFIYIYMYAAREQTLFVPEMKK